MTDNTTNQAAGGANAIDAATFFKLSGRPESYKAGSCLFPEAQRLSAIAPADVRIYLLVSGAVTLTRYGKPISLIMPGEMFGVNSVIHPTSHFATATAMKDCTAISLDPKQFLHELQKNPTFILTLLSDLARRLQGVMPRVIKTGRSTVEPPVSTALNADQIRLLAQKLGDPMPARSDAGGTGISEGARAIYRDVLKEGRVHIKVESRVIEVVLAGTVVGEMAVAGGRRRSAMAIAESASAWYSIDSKQLVAVTKADPALGLALLRSLAKRVQRAGQLLCESSLDLAALHIPRLNTGAVDGGGGAAKRAQQSALTDFKNLARAFVDQSAEAMAAINQALAASDKGVALTKANVLMAAAAKVGAERLCHQLDTLCTALSVGHKDIIDEVLVAVRKEQQDTSGEIRDFIGN